MCAVLWKTKQAMRHLAGKIQLGYLSAGTTIVSVNPELPFADSFELANFNKWSEQPSSPYGTIVTTPVYEGTYAAKLWTNNINITPLLANVLAELYDTLYFQSYLRFIRMPTLDLFYVAQIGRYRGAPFWSFVVRTIRLGVSKSGTKYYWIVNDILTSSEVIADTWYKVQLLSSRTLGKVQALIDDTLIQEIITTPVTVSSIGYIVYPTNAPIDDGFYIDKVDASDEPLW